jgi:hypothetical protein
MEYRGLNLNIMLKIEFQKIKVAYGLITEIMGKQIHLFLSSDSYIEKKYDVCTCGTFG